MPAQTAGAHDVPDGRCINLLWVPYILANIYYSKLRYQDHLDARGNARSKAFVMQGGIKAWLKEFGDAPDLVDNDPN